MIETALAKETGLSPAAKENLRTLGDAIAASGARLWITLGKTGPWLVPDIEKWALATERTEAHAMIFARLVARSSYYRKPSLPPFPALARCLNLLVAWLVRKRHPIILGYRKRRLAPLADEVRRTASDLPILSIRAAKHGWKEYGVFAKTLRNMARGHKEVSLLALPIPSREAGKAAARVINSVSDPVVRQGYKLASSAMIASTSLSQGLARHFTAVLKTASPRAVIMDAVGLGQLAALGEAAAKSRAPLFLLSHATHTPHVPGPAAEVMHRWARRGRVVSEFATELLPLTPHTAAVAKDASKELSHKQQAAYVWLSTDQQRNSILDSTRYILHAGNFSIWEQSLPWISETSDEFVEGLIVLAEAVRTISDVKLVVRIRPKSECRASVIQKLLPEDSRIEIKETGSLKEDLAAADVLVAYSSSTIEDALHARRPVFLWGASQRYRHLPARSEPPTSEDRAAVYAPRSQEGLVPLLEAVLAAHHGRPLTDEELKGHVWPEGTPDAKRFAQRLARANL